MEIVRSYTAKIHGSGSDMYKWVSGIEPEIRKRLRNGDNIVVVMWNGKSYPGQSGWKQISYVYGRYCHREPNGTILAALPKL
jgi:hypothetical protein